MRILLTLFILLMSVFANAEIYRVVEDGVVQEYAVDVTNKTESDIRKDIFSHEENVARIDRQIAVLIAEKDASLAEIDKLNAVLQELVASQPVPEEPIVDSTIYQEPEIDNTIY